MKSPTTAWTIHKHLVEVPAWPVVLTQVNDSNPTIKLVFAGLIIRRQILMYWTAIISCRIGVSMAIHLELETGLIKKYPTFYTYYYAVYGETASDIKRKCNISDDCDHLDCAIYAAEYTAKDEKSHFKMYIFICTFWFVIAIFNPGLGLGLGGFYALFGVYNIWQSDKAAKKAKELIEFRDHGTINGFKAHKL